MDRKLDLSGVRVYSNTKDDIIDAIDLIGQKVYMSDDEDFRRYGERELVGVCCEKDPSSAKFPFKGESVREWTHWYSYFVVCEDAKFKEEEEKKLRPFESVEEFGKETGCRQVGDVITIKRKENVKDIIPTEYTLLFTGYCAYQNRILDICLGGRSYTFEELKNDYLYFKGGEWHPFGVEE